MIKCDFCKREVKRVRKVKEFGKVMRGCSDCLPSLAQPKKGNRSAGMGWWYNGR